MQNHKICSVLRLIRPQQWPKNVLVLAAPFVAGDFFTSGDLLTSAIGLIVFCLASSATYVLNDIFDKSADMNHPTKKFRPIASQVISVRLGLKIFSLLIFSTFALSAILPTRGLVIIICYLATSILYSISLKNIPYVELFFVASGFIFRSVYGSIVVDLTPSSMFVLCVGYGSLFVVIEKRLAEQIKIGESDRITRKVLRSYSTQFLINSAKTTGLMFVASYSVWSIFELREEFWPGILRLSSVVPLGTAVYRYHSVAVNEQNDSPESILFNDRIILTCASLWVTVSFIALLLLSFSK